MTPGEIAITQNSKLGVTALRNYLQYASEGTLTFPKLSSKNFDSEFEVWVAESLAAKGFEVVPQLGVSGYFLDLAILDPNKPGSYLCAVECDGATYHSAASARDRDRLRQLVLENLGWKIYRVWSTDWFRNPVLELQKLLAFVGEQLASSSN
jgi:very-short-patch-repair endonuclease